MSTMLLVHKEFDNTLSTPGIYVHDNEDRVECALRLIQSKLGISLERHNMIHLHHSSILLFDVANLIHHHTYQGELWIEELLDGHMCSNVNTTTENQYTVHFGTWFDILTD